MPIPKPAEDENQDTFIERCMGDPTMAAEYPDGPQRFAICQAQWDKSALTEPGKSVTGADMKLLVVRTREACPAKRVVLIRDRSAYGKVDVGYSSVIRGGVDGQPYPVKWFEARTTLSVDDADTKKMTVVKDEDGTVSDYLDVPIKGYLSTFVATTEADRDGDYVEPGAFSETIKRFKKNPLILQDHVNSVTNVVGSFTNLREDNKGLWVEGMLSNAPGVKDLRFKVAEGHVRAMSMGGIFHYNESGRGIFKVDLWEGSLVGIPANPDALLSTRAVTDKEAKMIDWDVAGAKKPLGEYRTT